METPFITPEEIYTAIEEYQLQAIAPEAKDVRTAILAAIQEAASYLNGKYDCHAIFSATGDDRHVLLVEHCKSIAVWYMLRRNNTDILFERAKEYYKAAKEWLAMVAGVHESGRTIAADLPLRKVDGIAQTKTRSGSVPKFNSFFD